MRFGLALLALASLLPLASAASQEREAIFPMAQGFDDRMTVVSGQMVLDAPAATDSAAFFRTSGVEVHGLTKVCWSAVDEVAPQCVEGPIVLSVPMGSSFGFSSPIKYSIHVEAAHALASFIDLSEAEGFEGLHVGPSVLASMVDGAIRIGAMPTFTAEAVGGFTLLEDTGRLEVRSAGVLVHTLRPDDPPLRIEGKPIFPASFDTSIAVIPFDAGASATFKPAGAAAAKEGLAEDRMALLDTVLGNVRLIQGDAKRIPFQILNKAGAFLSEVFNGAFLRTSLADDPKGFGDVGFAKFDVLTISDGNGENLHFDGSYTLVVGDLGPSFNGSSVSSESTALRWWVGAFLLLGVAAMAAWLWLRKGPMGKPEPGPQTWFARIATSVGVVLAFLVWDWQLSQTLGSSLLTTDGGGAGLGVLVLIEVSSLLLAGLLIGVPVFLAVRYGLALANQPRYVSLASTAAVFFTVAFGVLLLPALVSFVVSLAG